MGLWFVLVAFALFTTAIVLWPLMRKSRSIVTRQQYDLSIFKDQLLEVERDLERGVIGESEAQAARIEISRKILHLGDNVEDADNIKTTTPVKAVNNMTVGMGLLVLICGASFGAYALIGSPALPGKPFAERISASNKNPSLDELVARVEAHLRKNPKDAKGWAIIAPSYMRLGRFADAANALERVVRLEKPNADVLASFGEALVMANKGVVDETARSAFKDALRLNPRQPTPQFYLGLAQSQAGNKKAAVALWNKMLKNAPANASWRPQIETQIKQAGGKVLSPSTPKTAPQDDGIPDIGEMVARLTARLEKDGDDLEGWLMLARSHMVQKNSVKAIAALDKAAAQFAGNEKAMTRITAARTAYGFDSKTRSPGKPAMDGAIPDIGEMVSGLAARLAEDGNDLNGWMMLARSYMVQKRPDDARKALDKAVTHFKTDAEAMSRIENMRKSLGL